MSDTDIGKWFENEVIQDLKIISEKYPVFYHRLLDTKAARKIVQPQPCDLLLASKPWGTVYLELKASMKYESATDAGKNLFRPTQIGKSKLIDRAGQPTMCLFYDGQNDFVELWDMTELLCSKRKSDKSYIFRCRLADMRDTLIDLMFTARH